MRFKVFNPQNPTYHVEVVASVVSFVYHCSPVVQCWPEEDVDSPVPPLINRKSPGGSIHLAPTRFTAAKCVLGFTIYL